MLLLNYLAACALLVHHRDHDEQVQVRAFFKQTHAFFFLLLFFSWKRQIFPQSFGWFFLFWAWFTFVGKKRERKKARFASVERAKFFLLSLFARVCCWPLWAFEARWKQSISAHNTSRSFTCFACTNLCFASTFASSTQAAACVGAILHARDQIKSNSIGSTTQLARSSRIKSLENQIKSKCADLCVCLSLLLFFANTKLASFCLCVDFFLSLTQANFCQQAQRSHTN